jgi:hypothetical protein
VARRITLASNVRLQVEALTPNMTTYGLNIESGRKPTFLPPEKEKIVQVTKAKARVKAGAAAKAKAEARIVPRRH